jgi:hypothetical protein
MLLVVGVEGRNRWLSLLKSAIHAEEKAFN